MGKLFIVDFISLVIVGSSYFLCSYISFSKLHFSRNLPQNLNFKFYWHESSHLFNVYRICSDTISFQPRNWLSVVS